MPPFSLPPRAPFLTLLLVPAVLLAVSALAQGRVPATTATRVPTLVPAVVARYPHATDASLSAFTKVVWIAGGVSKGVDYHQLVAKHAARLRHVLLIGTDNDALRQALAKHAPAVPVEDITAAATAADGTLPAGPAVMTRAVRRAHTLATAGDTVLMAPAAASIDQFTSYAQRGNAFISAVSDLMEHDPLTTDPAAPDPATRVPSAPGPGVVAAVAAAMAALDPQAEILLELECPACGAAFGSALDTGAYLLREIDQHASSLFAQVHTLALAYHWSEAEILDLPHDRRMMYLGLLDDVSAMVAP